MTKQDNIPIYKDPTKFSAILINFYLKTMKTLFWRHQNFSAKTSDIYLFDPKIWLIFINPFKNYSHFKNEFVIKTTLYTVYANTNSQMLNVSRNTIIKPTHFKKIPHKQL